MFISSSSRRSGIFGGGIDFVELVFVYVFLFVFFFYFFYVGYEVVGRGFIFGSGGISISRGIIGGGGGGGFVKGFGFLVVVGFFVFFFFRRYIGWCFVLFCRKVICFFDGFFE